MGKDSRDKENVLPHDNRYGTDSFDERHTVPAGNMRSFHGGRRGRCSACAMRDTHLFYGVPADGQDGGAGSKHSVFDGDRPEKVAD